MSEFRRGVDPAVITSMSFNQDGTKLAVASDKGTIHIFNLNNNNTDQSTSNTTAPIPDLLKPVLPKYFSSTWSFAHIRQREGRVVVAFAPEERNALIVVRHDGLYYKYMYDENRGGEAVLVCTEAF